ncbi:MAG: aminoacyl-tRNA hydrolase [Candidatus Zixiibacteriota bacterium]
MLERRSDKERLGVIRIICALGNPGKQYLYSRHNFGFAVLDRLRERLEIIKSGRANWFDYDYIRGDSGNLVLMKPATFVNRSGVAVAEALNLYSAIPSELFVIVDDFNLSLGSIRIRKSGSAGGHNGLAAIIETIEDDQFPRLRGGVGPLPEGYSGSPDKISDFVLSRFASDEIKVVNNLLNRSAMAVLEVIKNGLDLAISRYNNNNPTLE